MSSIAIKSIAAILCLSGFAAAASAQEPAAPPPPSGAVIFERHAADPANAQPKPPPAAVAASNAAPVDLSWQTITSYDLDAHITPASATLAMRARLTVRNDGPVPRSQIALQISSSLTWESVTSAHRRLPLTTRELETDADHTGRANEALIDLPAPLAPGAATELDAFYSGSISPDATRLTRIGASPLDAADADWDSIGENSVALRGFGNVLWYPVASKPLFLGEGATLFEAAGKMKVREQDASARLRLAIDYSGDPPAAVYFCGRRALFAAQSDDEAAPTASGTGIATAVFDTAPLGFRALSLFVLAHPEHPLIVAGHDAPPLITIETDADSALLQSNAADAATLLATWWGEQQQQTLAIIDHRGQPFQDGALLVAPLAALSGADGAQPMTYSLAHAFSVTGRPWIDEGLAQFFVLLQIERTRGRAVAIAAMNELVRPLMLVEPAAEAGKPMPPGEPLPLAANELYYRRKAANAWWMLRDLAGDQALQTALREFRSRPPSRNSALQDALSFEASMEKAADKDLHWFFDDWILHDRGLPDLVAGDVNRRELPANAGRGGGWSVAVTIRNEGAAAADVPVIVRSLNSSVTQRVRVPAFGSATARVLTEALPGEVIINDGSVPEQRVSTHVVTLAGTHPATP